MFKLIETATVSKQRDAELSIVCGFFLNEICDVLYTVYTCETSFIC